MTRKDGGGSAVSRAAMTVATLVLLATPACAQTRPDHPSATRLQSAGRSNDSAALIVRYSRSIDAEFDTAEGAGDKQRLMVGDCSSRPQTCRYGPLARIEPRLRRPNWEGPSARDTGVTARDSGEVIARIISDGPYRKFNVQGRDTVYWWVGPREGRLVSIFTSSKRGVRPLVSDLEVGPHYDPLYWKQGLARWIWKDRDEAVWGTCDGGRCCRSSGL